MNAELAERALRAIGTCCGAEFDTPDAWGHWARCLAYAALVNDAKWAEQLMAEEVALRERLLAKIGGNRQAEIFERAGSLADQAVVHIIERVSRDRNFRHYMIGTESLALCLKAQAERLGLAKEAINKITAFNDAPPAKGNGREIADVTKLRQRLEKIDAAVCDIHQRGRLTEEDYTTLCDSRDLKLCDSLSTDH